mgnify:FL=1
MQRRRKGRRCGVYLRQRKDKVRAMDEQNDGYSGLFYVMLVVGIVGVLGFVLVAAGGGR